MSEYTYPARPEKGSTEDVRSDMALREGLRSLPVPETAPDFDARVLDALRRPAPWWQTAWASLRPVLSAAACALVVLLPLLSSADARPDRMPLPLQTASPRSTARAFSPDSIAANPNLRGDTLHPLGLPLQNRPAQVAPPEPKPAAPGRRSQLSAFLTA